MSLPDDITLQPALDDGTVSAAIGKEAPETENAATKDHPPRSNKLETAIIEAIKDGDMQKIEDWINEIGRESSDRINEIVDESEKQLQSGNYHYLMRKGMTALHYAALYSKKEIVEVLLKAGADPGVKNVQGENVILFAVQNDNDDAAVFGVLSLILKPKKTSYSLNAGNGRQETPLYFAAMKYRPKTIQLLLKHGADPEVKSDSGKNAFHIVCQYIDEDSEAAEIMKKLLHKRNPSLDEREKVHQRTPLHYAARKYMAKTIRVLVKHGADATLKDNGKCPIHVAISTTSSTAFEHMMACLKKNFDLKESDGRTVLHLAVIQNKVEYVRVLMDKGYEKLRTIKDKSGKYPIDYACEYISPDFEEMVQLLYTSENKYQQWEVTPLQRIAQKNDASLLKILLKYGADPQWKTYGGRTLLHIATVSEEGTDEGFEKLIELLTTRTELIKTPLGIDDRDEKGTTPLHLALHNRKFSRVSILLGKEADPSIPNDVMKNGLHIAFESNAGGPVIRELLNKCRGIDSMRDDIGKIPVQYMSGGTPVSAIKALDHITPSAPDQDMRRHFSITHSGDGRDHEVLVQIEEAKFGTPGMEHSYVEARLMSYQNQYFYSKEKKNDDPAYSQILEFQNVLKSEADGSTLLLREYDKREKTKIHRQTRYNVSFKFDKEKAICSPAQFHQEVQDSPLKMAIDLDRIDIVEVLLVKGAQLDRDTLMAAVKRGDKALVQVFIRHLHESYLDDLLNEIYTLDKTKELTTPFRELISKTPDAAKEALQRNFKNDSKSVTFDYSLLEPWHPILPKKLRSPDIKGSLISPLKLMVEHNRIELLEHPVIGSFLHMKWNRIGFWYYIFTLVLFVSFLASLSLFSLIVNRPSSAICQNATDSELNECGTKAQITFIFIFAISTIVLAFILEILQIIRYRWIYFKELKNYGELLLYILSMIYVFVFFNNCKCPLDWQWQVGIFAVFLGWMNLIVYASKFPKTGIYVLIFYKILLTFLKLISFSILLILAFSLILFMTFNNPDAETSFFSNIGHSFMTVLTGELEFGGWFNLENSPSDYTPIPYHASGFLIWIIFIVLVPIILNNMLVSLAVGDTEEIKNSAKIKKLDLQVRTVLQAEEFLPHAVLKCLDPKPGDDDICEENGIQTEDQTQQDQDEIKLEMIGDELPEVRVRADHAQSDPKNRGHPKIKMELDESPSVWKRAWRRIQLFIWGGKDYLEQVQVDNYHEEREEERKQIEGDVEDDDESLSEDITMKQLFCLVKNIEKKLSGK